MEEELRIQMEMKDKRIQRYEEELGPERVRQITVELEIEQETTQSLSLSGTGSVSMAMGPDKCARKNKNKMISNESVTSSLDLSSSGTGVGVGAALKHKHQSSSSAVPLPLPSDSLNGNLNPASLATIPNGTKGERKIRRSEGDRQAGLGKSVRSRYQVTPKSTSSKTWSCAECAKVFKTKQDLTRHQRIHSGEKPFKFNACNAKFTWKSNLTRHARVVHHGMRDYKFQCIFCKKWLKSNGYLEEHLRVHTLESTYFCKICSYEGMTKGSLIKHMKVHQTDRDKIFKCNLCAKSFFTKDSLNKHIRNHTGEKYFKCNLCTSSFKTNGDLKSLKGRIHRSARP